MHVKSKDNWIKHFDFMLLDVAVLFASFLLANIIYLKRLDYYSNWLFWSVFLSIIIPNVIINLMDSPFSGILRRGTITEIRKAVEYVLYDFVFTAFILYIFKIGPLFSRMTVILTYIIFLVLIIFVRIFWKKLVITGKIRFSFSNDHSLLIVSNIDNIYKVLNNINKEEYQQYDIKGICILDKNIENTEIEGIPVLCEINRLHDCMVENNIGEVFINANPNCIDKRTISSLIDEGIGIHLDISQIYGIETDEQHIDKVGIYKTLGLGLYIFTASQSIYLVIKRIFDIFFSILVLIPSSLLLCLVKISYLISGDTNNIFYHQTRVGQNGKLFELYKIRSMIPNAEEALIELLKDENNLKEWNEYHKLKNDPRITKVGAFLRKTSLDELPQFINVLKGDMSIIGPRPLVKGELKMHNGLKLYERVKPGITGWWACNGRSNISYEERLEMEYYYVKNCSFSLDVLTFLRTIYVVLRKTGAE